MEPSARSTIPKTMALFAGLALAMVLLRDREGLRALFRARTPNTEAPSRPTAALPFVRTPTVATPTPPTVTPPALPTPWNARAPRDRNVRPIDDPCLEGQAGDAGIPCRRYALDAFYDRLARLELRQRSRVRIVHVGDSIVADDKITGRLRARMQAEFGDAGLGFLFLRQPARWYHPRGATFVSRGWELVSVVGPRVDDQRYGPGGAAFEARERGPVATVGAPRVARATVHYLGGAGTLSVRVDEEAWRPIPETANGIFSLETTAGAHSISVRAESGPVRAFGVTLESGERGVLVDNLGLVSSSARSLVHQDEAHWRAELARLEPDLFVFSLGTNDASHGPIWPAQRAELLQDFSTMLRTMRAAAPGAACLVLAPPDSAEERGGPLATRAAILPILEAQRAAARAEGCGFWDTWAWMGGRNAILRWRRNGWAEADHTHVTDAGGARIADAVADALLAGRDAFMQRGGAARSVGVEPQQP